MCSTVTVFVVGQHVGRHSPRRRNVTSRRTRWLVRPAAAAQPGTGTSQPGDEQDRLDAVTTAVASRTPPALVQIGRCTCPPGPGLLHLTGATASRKPSATSAGPRRLDPIPLDPPSGPWATRRSTCGRARPDPASPPAARRSTYRLTVGGSSQPAPSITQRPSWSQAFKISTISSADFNSSSSERKGASAPLIAPEGGPNHGPWRGRRRRVG